MNKSQSKTTMSPVGLADMTLINAPQCAAIGNMGPIWWRRKVAEGRAPRPAVRRPRCTRWRTTEVLSFWERFAESGGSTEAKGAQR